MDIIQCPCVKETVVNRCGFHIVEFYNSHHPDPNEPDDHEEGADDDMDGMFRFQKVMR